MLKGSSGHFFYKSAAVNSMVHTQCGTPCGSEVPPTTMTPHRLCLEH